MKPMSIMSSWDEKWRICASHYKSQERKLSSNEELVLSHEERDKLQHKNEQL